MAAQSRLWAGHDFGARTAPTAVERVLRRFQRHLVTASVPWRRRARRIGSWRRISAALIGAFAGTLLLTPPAFAVDVGSLDAAFTTANGTGANSDVRSIAVQADQKIIIGGDFTTWNGAAVGRVVRLTTGGDKGYRVHDEHRYRRERLRLLGRGPGRPEDHPRRWLNLMGRNYRR